MSKSNLDAKKEKNYKSFGEGVGDFFVTQSDRQVEIVRNKFKTLPEND